MLDQTQCLDQEAVVDLQPFLVDNKWVHGGGTTLLVTNPADGSVLAHVSGADALDVDAAVAAARRALRAASWSGLKPHQRATHLYRMSELMTADLERLAVLQMRDNGKTLKECRAQVASAAYTFRYYAAACETFESEVTPPRGEYWTVTLYEPVGVIAAITPWNSPVTLEAQKLAPILAAGNTVILKPSDVTPLMGLEYAKLALAAGFPPGVVNVVTGGPETGKQLVEHKGVNMVSFTGGTSTGRLIATACARALKPAALELGGKSPNIVFADADLDKAVIGTGDGIFSGGGQSCIAGSRIFVAEEIYDSFIEKLQALARDYRMGSPEQPDTKMGPLASFSHRERVEEYVRIGLDEGARLVVGGVRPQEEALKQGAYYPATILTGVTNASRVCREEIFGPVAVVLSFKDEADLISQANDSDFGLAAGIWTSDFQRAWRVARALEAGTVWINTYKQLSITTPFGGVKDSGIGSEKGLQGMKAYMHSKGIYWGLN